MNSTANLSCLNCSADLGTANDDLPAFYTLNCSSRVRSPLSPATVELIPIHHALATVFNFKTLAQLCMSKDHENTDVSVNINARVNDPLKDFQSTTSTAPICFSCYLVLSDLYRSYIEFNQLRNANSFLGSKLKELENQFKLNLKNHTPNQSEKQNEIPIPSQSLQVQNPNHVENRDQEINSDCDLNTSSYIPPDLDDQSENEISIVYENQSFTSSILSPIIPHRGPDPVPSTADVDLGLELEDLGLDDHLDLEDLGLDDQLELENFQRHDTNEKENQTEIQTQNLEEQNPNLLEDHEIKAEVEVDLSVFDFTPLDFVKAEISSDCESDSEVDEIERIEMENTTEEGSTDDEDHGESMKTKFQNSEPVDADLISSSKNSSANTNGELGENSVENGNAVILPEEVDPLTKPKAKINAPSTSSLSSLHALSPIIAQPEPVPGPSTVNRGLEFEDHLIQNLSKYFHRGDDSDADFDTDGSELNVTENGNMEVEEEETGDENLGVEDSSKDWIEAPSMVWMGHEDNSESGDDDWSPTSGNNQIKKRKLSGDPSTSFSVKSMRKSCSEPGKSESFQLRNSNGDQKSLPKSKKVKNPSKKIPLWNHNPALNPNPSVCMKKLPSTSTLQKSQRSYRHYHLVRTFPKLCLAKMFLDNDFSADWMLLTTRSSSVKGRKVYYQCKFNGTDCPARVYILHSQGKFEIWKASEEHDHRSAALKRKLKCNVLALSLISDLYNSGIYDPQVVHEKLQEMNIVLTSETIRTVIDYIRKINREGDRGRNARSEHDDGSTSIDKKLNCSVLASSLIKDLYNSGIRDAEVVREKLQEMNIELTSKCIRNVLNHIGK